MAWWAERRRSAILECLYSAAVGVTVLVGVLAAGAPALAQTVPGSAQGPQSPIRFAIAPQPLSGAIVAFSRASGINIVSAGVIPQSARTSGVSGMRTPRQALAMLLAGTGYAYRFTSASSVTIVDPNAGGNDAAATVDGAIALDTIDVSGGGTQAAADLPYRTPGSSAYISAQEIATRSQTTVGDTFKGVPGILFGDDNNGPKFDPSIRGLGVDRVPVRIDGASASITEYRGYSGAATSNYVDPDLIGGISIKKGPEAGAEGIGTIGGLVSMRTLNADDLLKPGASYGIRLRGGVGDNTRSPRIGQIAGVYAGGPASVWNPDSYTGSAAVAAKQENFEFVAAYVHREAGNYFAGRRGPEWITIPSVIDRNRAVAGIRQPSTLKLSNYYGPGSEVLNTSQNMDSWLVKGTLKFSEDHQLEIAHLGYRNIYGQSMPSMTQISFIPDWNKQLEPARAAQDNYTARYRWNPRDNDLIDLKANAYTAHLNNQTMMNAQTQANINAGVEPFMSSRIRTSGLDISNTSRFSPAWGDMSLTYGAAYMNEDVAPLQTNAESSFLSSNGTRQTAAVFANGEWSPWRWLTIDAGLRYDSFKTRDRADPNDLLQPGYGNASPALAGHSLEGHGVSPHASVTLKPFDGVQLYAMYVEGFRAPNIWEATNNVIALNPDLKPERAKNWEIGANFSRDNVIRNGDKARLKVSYFDNTIHDIIVRDYFFTSPPPGGTFYYRRNNYDRARFSGVEVSGKYDSGKVFADFSATYYTRVEYCRNRYPNVPGEYYWAAYGYGCQNGPYANDYMSNQVPPQFSASALLGVRLFDDRLTLSGRITHMGDRAGSYIDYILPSTMWTAYNVYDAFLSYKVDDTWTVNVSAENLTDRYYFKPLSQATLPAPGRTIRATLTGTFDASAAAKRRDADPADASAAGDWTGFYVGTHLGYGIGRDARQMTSITGASDALAAGETANHAFKDINRGLQVGYNYQLTNRVVLGLESDISWLGYDRSWEDVSTEAPTSPNKLQATVDTSLNWLATLRGRIGYAIDDSLMLYATGGAAFLNQTEKRTQFRMTDPLGAGSIPAFEENASATRVGLSLGAGAEYQIGGGWSLKGEYMFAGFGEDIFKFRNARTGVNPGGTAFDFTLPGCNLFFNPMTCMVNIPSTSDGVSGRKLTSSIDIHMLKFGINYRF